MNKHLSISLVPSWSSNTPLYPSKVLRAKECASTLDSSVVFSLDSHLNLLRSLGAHHVPQHVPNDTYLLSWPHWQMASSSFFVPIIFPMGSKNDFNIFLNSQCVPNTHHITIHLYLICGGKCYPHFITEMV